MVSSHPPSHSSCLPYLSASFQPCLLLSKLYSVSGILLKNVCFLTEFALATVIEWSLNQLGSLNDLAIEPQQLQVLLEYVSSRLLYTPGSPCGQLLK